jgi:hypothetical protein
VASGPWKLECFEQVELLRGGLADAGVGVTADGGAVLLDATEDFQCGFRAAWAAMLLQSCAHDAIEQQRQEADQRMCADAFGQAVVDRCDLQVALEYAEATFDVGQALVALDDVRGRKVLNICQQHELAVEHLRALDRCFVHAIAEAIGVVVGLDEAGQFGVRNGLLEAQQRGQSSFN